MTNAFMEMLQKYYLTTFVVGCVLVILALVGVRDWWSSSKSTLLSNSDSSKIRFPPWISNCPDYWKQNEDGTCSRAFNNGLDECDASGLFRNGKGSYSQKKGTSLSVPLNSFSFVEKCKWCSKCKVHWEGISDKPCMTESFQLYQKDP